MSNYSEVPVNSVDGQDVADMSFSLAAQGVFMGVPMEAIVIHDGSGCVLSGEFSLSADSLVGMLNSIQPASGDDFRKTALFPILQMFDGEAVIVSRSDGPTAFVWKLDEGMVGVISEENSLIVTIATSDSVHSTGLGDSAFDSFISKLQQTIGALNIRFAYKNGSSLNFSQGQTILQQIEKSVFGDDGSMFVLPEHQEFKDASILVFSEVDLSKGNLGFLGVLSKVLPGDSDITATAAFGSNSYILLSVKRDGNADSGSLLDIRTLECDFYMTEHPKLTLSGQMVLSVDKKQYSFIIDSSASADNFSLGAEYTSMESPISLGSFFSIYQLGISVAYEKSSLVFGGYGSLKLGKLDLFALIFMRSEGSSVSLSALGLAFDRVTVPVLLSVFGIDVPGADEFDFLSIDALPLNAGTMDVAVLSDLSETGLKSVADSFANACSGDCGGQQVVKVSADKILVRKVEDGWMLTDENSVRHYLISDKGAITLAPQLYFCVDDSIQAGSYTLYKGLFLCASIQLFNIKVNLFLEITDGVGLETLVNIAPIDLKWLSITSSSKQRILGAAQNFQSKENNLIEQYISSTAGPTLYLCAKPNNLVFYLDAAVNILGLIKVNALLTYESGNVHLDAGFQFFSIGARISLTASYADFNSGKFDFAMVLDLTFFQDIANNVAGMVKAFVADAQSKISSAQAQLSQAEQKVMGLQNQINQINGQIDDKRSEIKHLKWYKMYKAVGILAEIGGLEVEKAGIYIALGTASAALEVAKQILAGVNKVTGAIGQLIEKLAQAISSIFYLKSVEFAIGASAAAELKTNMSICFTLFGKDYNASAGLTLSGDVSGAIHSTASSNITNETQAQLNNLNTARELFSDSQKTLQSVLADSDFIYDDFDGYKKCLSDAFVHLDKSAATDGYMEAVYSNNYGGEDPMSEYNSGVRHRTLSSIKSQWQGVFSMVSAIDCGELIEEAKRQTSVNNTISEENAAMLGAAEDQWNGIQMLQEEIKNQSERISNMDVAYFDKKSQSCLKHSKSQNVRSESTEEASIGYLRDVIVMFTGDLKDDADYDGFSFDDSENYFINPANEPILNDLYEELCENSKSEVLSSMKDEIAADGDKKRNVKNYRTRIV